jgi:hypothetical protein
LVGFITGDLWWPMGVPAVKEVRISWRSDCGRSDGINPCSSCGTAHYSTLGEAVEALMRREDGDFSSAARLTADSYLYAERSSVHWTHAHRYEVGMLASVSEYVSDAFGSDAIDGEEA